MNNHYDKYFLSQFHLFMWVGHVFTNTRDYSCISFSANNHTIYLHPASLGNRGMILIQQSQWQNSWSILKEIIPSETF